MFTNTFRFISRAARTNYLYFYYNQVSCSENGKLYNFLSSNFKFSLIRAIIKYDVCERVRFSFHNFVLVCWF